MPEPEPAPLADDSAPPVPVAAAGRPGAHTLREFGFQLSTITAGVLIALSVDGVVEWRRERALVREAQAAIDLEIASNLRDLDETLPGLEAHQRALARALRFADDLIATGKTEVHEVRFGFNIASLNRASWQTADRTGALALMDYADVKGYAELYSFQELFVAEQHRLVEQIASLTAVLYGGKDGDPTRLRPRDLEVFRLRVLDATGAIDLHRRLAAQLVAAYKTRTRFRGLPGRRREER
jgi:hypothetical protein